MKKRYSVIMGIFMFFGNGAIASFFPESMQAVVKIVCICIGAVCVCMIVKAEEEYRKSKEAMTEKLIAGVDNLDKSISERPSWKQFEKVCKDNNEILNEIQSVLIHDIDMKNDAVNQLFEQMQTYQKELTDIIASFGEQIRSDHTKHMEDTRAVLNANIVKITENANQNNKAVIAFMRESYESVCQKEQAAETELKNIYVAVTDGNAAIEKILLSLELLKDMSDGLYQMHDEFLEKLAQDADNHCEMLQDLCEDLNENNKSAVKKIRDGMQNIVDSIDSHESELSNEIKKLAQQYIVFKDYTQELVKKMTFMSDEDYKLLKGLMDGKQRK